MADFKHNKSIIRQVAGLIYVKVCLLFYFDF